MASNNTTLIVGAGPGLGLALARRFAQASMKVAMAARNQFRLEALIADNPALAPDIRAYGCDATDEASVIALFDQVRADLGTPEVVIYNAGAFVQRSFLMTGAEEFERCWKIGCLGGFLVGRTAARLMCERVKRGGTGGTILFTGATASMRGGAGFHNLAVGKFGLRALAQSMARELQPQGIHVAHVVIDGRIRPPRADTTERDAMLDPAAIAEAYYQLHRQHRSAWSHEIDLRPWVEKF